MNIWFAETRAHINESRGRGQLTVLDHVIDHFLHAVHREFTIDCSSRSIAAESAGGLLNNLVSLSDGWVDGEERGGGHGCLQGRRSCFLSLTVREKIQPGEGFARTQSGVLRLGALLLRGAGVGGQQGWILDNRCRQLLLS